MTGIPLTGLIPVLPEWQVHFAWGMLAVVALGMFTLVLWRVVRSFRERRLVRCPVMGIDAEVILRIDPATDTPAEVVRCSLLDPPHDVTCSQSCVHNPPAAPPKPARAVM